MAIFRTVSSMSGRMQQANGPKKSSKYFWQKGGQAGLTLIECLVAIAVIGSTIGVIAPIVVLSTATRLQNQRFEQAAQLAQAEATRIRVLVERGGAYTAEIDERVAQVAVDELMENVGPPTSLAYSAPSTPTVGAARTVDINNDGTQDFAVQVFRTNNNDDGDGDTDDDNDIVISDSGESTAFNLGVRVYRYKTVKEAIDASRTLETERASLNFTSGEGQGSNRPLAVLYANIVKSDEQESLCDYHAYASASTPSLPSVCSP